MDCVLITKGAPITNRAKLLGHSVEVNLKNYSFEEHDYCKSTKSLLDS